MARLRCVLVVPWPFEDEQMQRSSREQRRRSSGYHSAMSFFAILFALLIEQVRPLGPRNPIHSRLRGWARWVSRNFDAGKTHHGWVAWCLAVLAPSAAAAPYPAGSPRPDREGRRTLDR